MSNMPDRIRALAADLQPYQGTLWRADARAEFLTLADEIERQTEADARAAVGRLLGLGNAPTWVAAHRRLTDEPASVSELCDHLARVMGVSAESPIVLASVDYTGYTGDHRSHRAIASFRLLGDRRG